MQQQQQKNTLFQKIHNSSVQAFLPNVHKIKATLTRVKTKKPKQQKTPNNKKKLDMFCRTPQWFHKKKGFARFFSFKLLSFILNLILFLLPMGIIFTLQMTESKLNTPVLKCETKKIDCKLNISLYTLVRLWSSPLWSLNKFRFCSKSAGSSILNKFPYARENWPSTLHTAISTSLCINWF